MFRTIQVLKFISLLMACQIYEGSAFGMGQKTWNFEFISIGGNSSAENLVKFDLGLKQISRGVYGISGTVDIFVDIVEGDNTMIEARVFRSATGSSEYKVTPFTVPRQHVYEFFNTFYKDIIMNSLKDCSDLPYFEKKFQPPLEKKTYTLESCQLSNEGMPQHMFEGVYKLDLIGSGKFDWVVEGIVKVENDM